MKRHILLIVCCLLPILATAQKDPSPRSIYVDKKGVMRWEKSHEEASFYGVNYTVPFAHAYRAIGYLGLDHKAAIDKDVYHFARLGFNAYRIHVWDVEISDEKGNLIENDHLDLLDYLIAKLQERNIKTVITAMTNFGNGYPERNQPTGGFSYLYDKCDIHDNEEAIRAQQQYIASLVSHFNPYTGKKYMDDPDIVGFEINNEPCHAGTQAQTRSYITKMVQAIRKTGNKKPVFYNVSHNMQQVEAYFNSPVQGTTYQWYPIGLVAGHTRKGNFLPYVDNYHIPFNNLNGFSNKAKLVYEYDPADITYSYMYPAMTRSFRSAGFQWITQFAYDPIDMAWANTEYQTHFLNLAYTPQKAISMKIAAEVAYNTPMYKSYGSYPADTLFGDFRVSYKEDLSVMNTAGKFFYSNHTSTCPVDPAALSSITGYGNSPVIKYGGTGAYFLDKLENGVWRLEVMPDAVQIKDPFERPSLQKEVVTIIWNAWDMTIDLPDLGSNFTITGLNEINNTTLTVNGQTISQVQPGVYLLKKAGVSTSNWNKDTQWENIRLGEYVAPRPHSHTWQVFHEAPHTIEAGKPLALTATIAGPETPDSVIVYTDKISFWNRSNPYSKMERKEGYTWQATLPAERIQTGTLNYYIVVCEGEMQYTFPSGIAASPLAWDYTAKTSFSADVVAPESPVRLFTPSKEQTEMESYIIPESWNIQRQLVEEYPTDPTMLRFTFQSKDDQPRFYLRTPIREKVENRLERVAAAKYICLQTGTIPADLQVGFLTTDGYTYTTTIKGTGNSVVKVPLSELQQTSTAFLPHAYPSFLGSYFHPETTIPFDNKEIEQLEISFPGTTGESYTVEVGNIWLE